MRDEIQQAIQETYDPNNPLLVSVLYGSCDLCLKSYKLEHWHPEQPTYTQAQLADAIRAYKAKVIERIETWCPDSISEVIEAINSLPIGDEK